MKYVHLCTRKGDQKTDIAFEEEMGHNEEDIRANFQRKSGIIPSSPRDTYNIVSGLKNASRYEENKGKCNFCTN